MATQESNVLMKNLATGATLTNEAGWVAVNLTAATTLVKTGAGFIRGITINSHTVGSISLRDGTTSGASLIHSTMYFATGERTIDLQGEAFSTGLFVSLGGGADITLRYQ